jgi:heme exporter protein B
MKGVIINLKHEWAQIVAGAKLGSLFLFTVSATFSIYLALGPIGRELSPMLWSVLFWVIQIFSALQISERMYGTDFQAHRIFYYQNSTSVEMLVAKFLAQLGLQMVLALATTCLFTLLFGTIVGGYGYLLLSSALGAWALTALYQVVGAIASATSHPARYTAVLGTPLAIPVLLESIRSTKRAIDGLDMTLNSFATLPAFAIIALGLAVLLYPQVWHE